MKSNILRLTRIQVCYRTGLSFRRVAETGPAARFILRAGLLTLALCLFATGPNAPAIAQTASSDQTQEELLGQAEQAVEKGRADQLDVYSPKHFGRAADALDEARSLIERKRERELIRIKLMSCLDEVKEARESAKVVRSKLGPAIAERTAAADVHADQLNPDGWKRADDKLYAAVRDIERGVESIPDGEIQEIAGAYRALRREAMRTQILGESRSRIETAQQRGAEKLVPTLVLRAHQALGRAEAALAQENLDQARTDATLATGVADHITGLMGYVDTAERQKNSWETALLPYDDLLERIARRLGGTLDFSHGGAATYDQFETMISRTTDSVQAVAAQFATTNASLEASLQEAQTSLADAQNRIIQLEQRIKTLESQHSESKGALQKNTELTQLIAQAQELFKPGEAVILQDERGRVVIRVYAVNFAAGQSDVEKSQLKIIGKVATAVQKFPGAKITVEGHTDSDGKEEVNQTLSEQRALAVGAALADALKVRADTLTAMGFGESKPIADNATKEGRARNRRIDVVLTLP
ncbi:OmpA family protein [candidate division KSB1 bacterium]|nr:OmpA family protein [candidate division KSB1 bacterium]